MLLGSSCSNIAENSTFARPLDFACRLSPSFHAFAEACATETLGIYLDEKNTSRDVYADSAYRSAEHEADLKQRKFRPHLQRKGCKGHQLTSREKRGNLTRARIRSRIEHVFGAIHQRAGDVILRTIGISMAEVKLGLRNIAYNMDRFCTLMLQNA